MVCGKCRYEFCWLCLGSYSSYQHEDSNHCPWRWSALMMTLVFLCMMLNQKLLYFCSWVHTIEWFMVYGIGGLILMDMIVLSLGSYLLLFGGII